MFHKYKTYYIIALIIPLFFISHRMLLNSTNQIQETFLKENLQYTQEIQKNINTYLNHKIGLLTFITDLDDFKNDKNYSIKRILTKTIYSESDNRCIFIFDKEGNVLDSLYSYPRANDLFNVTPDLGKTNVADRDYFQNSVKGKIYVSDILKNKLTNTEFIAISIPYFDSECRIKGVICLTFEPDELLRFFNTETALEGSNIVIDGAGNIITNQQNKYPAKIKYKLSKYFDLSKKASIQTTPFDKKRKVISYLPVENTNWHIFTIQSFSLLEKQIYMDKLKQIAILATFFIPIGLFSFLYLKELEKKRLIEIIGRERINSITEIAASVAHEIRNPLVAIKGFIQYEKHKSNSSIGLENIDIMLKEIDQIETLLTELLKLSKDTQAKFTEFCLNEKLLNAFNLMKSQAQIKCINYKINLPDEDIMIKGDPKLILDLVINVIRNSFAAVEKKGSVKISLFSLENNAELIIHDSGDGIPENIIENIGNPFNSENKQTLGLGLAICEKIIRLHEGSWTIKTDSILGTVVHIILPKTKPPY